MLNGSIWRQIEQQPGIATPAFVLAKAPRHQHQIGVQGPTKLESSLEVSQGRPRTSP